MLFKYFFITDFHLIKLTGHLKFNKLLKNLTFFNIQFVNFTRKTANTYIKGIDFECQNKTIPKT